MCMSNVCRVCMSYIPVDGCCVRKYVHISVARMCTKRVCARACVQMYATGVIFRVCERSQNQEARANLRTGCGGVEGSGGGGMEKAAAESSLHGERPSDHRCFSVPSSADFCLSFFDDDDEAKKTKEASKCYLHLLHTTHAHVCTHVHTCVCVYVCMYMHACMMHVCNSVHVWSHVKRTCGWFISKPDRINVSRDEGSVNGRRNRSQFEQWRMESIGEWS
jgi:hypothetical protein